MPLFAVPPNCPACMGDAFAAVPDMHGGILLQCRSCGGTVAEPSDRRLAEAPARTGTPIARPRPAGAA